MTSHIKWTVILLCFLIDFRSSAANSVNATKKEVGTLPRITVQVKEDESLSACGKESVLG